LARTLLWGAVLSLMYRFVVGVAGWVIFGVAEWRLYVVLFGVRFPPILRIWVFSTLEG